MTVRSLQYQTLVWVNNPPFDHFLKFGKDNDVIMSEQDAVWSLGVNIVSTSERNGVKWDKVKRGLTAQCET
jgi:hypothetical protein